VNVCLAVGSLFVRIGDMAFHVCSALRLLFLTSSVEFVGEECFLRCILMWSLTIGSSSHLRQSLDLPCPLRGSSWIADSVETLRLFGSRESYRHQVLNIGHESRLSEIRTAALQGRDLSLLRGSLLVVSTRSLKEFRKNIEFRPRK
jgi:hypothetical protein